MAADVDVSVSVRFAHHSNIAPFFSFSFFLFLNVGTFVKSTQMLSSGHFLAACRRRLECLEVFHLITFKFPLPDFTPELGGGSLAGAEQRRKKGLKL